MKELYQTIAEMSDPHVGYQVQTYSVANLVLFTATLESHDFYNFIAETTSFSN